MRRKFAALFLGWLVPGLGHVYLGKRWKGTVLFVVLTCASLVGLAMGRFRNVYFEPSHYQFYAEIGNGLFTLAASGISAAVRATPVEKSASAGYLASTLPVADLYLMVAGLLNFVAAANAFDLAGRPKEGKE
ncbi:MAG: DUF6677 family protein [Planctomycetota bacterium]|jgi:hypothetical protein